MKILVGILMPVILFNIFLGIFNSKYIEIRIEENRRQQARVQLQSAKYSINRLVNEENIEIEKAVDIVMRKIRNGGETGDGHAYYLSYAQSLDTPLFFDASSDCKPGDKVYTLKEVLQFFKDPKSAELAFKQILLGEDSNYKTKLSWNFDESPEWLEYIKMPTNDTNQKEGAYMLVLGTQQDEIERTYMINKILNSIFLGTSTVIQLLFITLFYFLIDVKCKNGLIE